MFIQVDIDGLRALRREHGLTRAEVAELVLLALYMDHERHCRPGKEDSVEKIGMKSASNARRLQRSLKRKGALDWDFDHQWRSPRFTLPTCFNFGADSYQRSNSDSRGSRNINSRGSRNSNSRGRSNCDSEQEPPSTKTNGTKPRTTTQTGALNEAGLALTTPDQRATIRRLTEAGVSDLEAVLIAQQYRQDTIAKAITDSARPTISNRGGWIRRAVELIANQPLHYPAVPRKKLVAEAAMAVTAARTSSPSRSKYLDDPYYSRHDVTYNPDDGDTYSASDGDTGNPGDGDTHSGPGELTGARQPF